MRIDHYCGGPVRKNSSSELRNRHHARFNVDMAINQPRTEEITLYIDDLSGLIISETYNHTSKDGDILFFNLAGEDIYNPPVLNQKINPSFARGDPDSFFE